MSNDDLHPGYYFPPGSLESRAAARAKLDDPQSDAVKYANLRKVGDILKVFWGIPVPGVVLDLPKWKIEKMYAKLLLVYGIVRK